jgi:hypothetical protein
VTYLHVICLCSRRGDYEDNCLMGLLHVEDGRSIFLRNASELFPVLHGVTCRNTGFGSVLKPAISRDTLKMVNFSYSHSGDLTG